MKTVPLLLLLALAKVALGVNAFGVPAQYTVTFDQPTYTAVAGKASTAKVIISPVPPNGLFSFGVVVSLAGGNLTGQPFSMTVPVELDFDTVRASRARSLQAGRTAVAKGSVDFHAIPVQPYRKAVLATMDLGPLPKGTYTLSVAPKNDLGPTEQIFVDGAAQNLDPLIKFTSAKLVVQKGETLAGPILLNRQTGLFEQTYRLVNSFTEEYDGLRVYLDNLPPGVTVWNAWNIHIDSDGRPYVIYDGILAPGESVVLTIEYNIPSRRILPQTLFTVALPGEDEFVLPGTDVFTTLPGRRLSNGQVLLEFNGALDQEYFIQYSYDNTLWRTVMPSVFGLGTKQQWVDNGPPKTESKPQSAAPRTYRILKVK